jgi:hypothetical protein
LNGLVIGGVSVIIVLAYAFNVGGFRDKFNLGAGILVNAKGQGSNPSDTSTTSSAIGSLDSFVSGPPSSVDPSHPLYIGPAPDAHQSPIAAPNYSIPIQRAIANEDRQNNLGAYNAYSAVSVSPVFVPPPAPGSNRISRSAY